MRYLKTRDLAKFSKIINKMNIKDDVMGLFTDITNKTEEEFEEVNNRLAIEIILMFISNYWKAEEETYSLLADLNGVTVEDIKELELSEVITMIRELKEDPSFSSFLKLVA